MYNTGNKLVIYQLQNTKLNFPKFCKMYALQNQKANLIYLYIHLIETFALILHSKIVFKNLFWLTLSIIKKMHYMHLTLEYLVTHA